MRGHDRAGLAALVLAALAACGGGGKAADDGPGGDGGAPSDAPGMPPPPALGAQLDRMGRPGVGEYLIGTFGGTDAAARQAAYGQATDPKAWLTASLATNVTVASEMEANLAAFDAIDTGQTINMTTLPGCTNALSYRQPPNAMSYASLATLLADDQLYVDTAKATCTEYFALEIELTSSGSSLHSTCGGRTLRHDALDVLVSVLTSGLAGLDPANQFAPRTHSAATAHPDITDTFPFLGAPNP